MHIKSFYWSTDVFVFFPFLGLDFAFGIAHIYIGSLILEFAQITKNDLDVNLAYTWSITRNVSPLFSSVLIKNSTEDFDDKIVFEGYDMKSTTKQWIKKAREDSNFKKGY